MASVVHFVNGSPEKMFCGPVFVAINGTLLTQGGNALRVPLIGNQRLAPRVEVIRHIQVGIKG